MYYNFGNPKQNLQDSEVVGTNDDSSQYDDFDDIESRLDKIAKSLRNSTFKGKFSIKGKYSLKSNKHSIKSIVSSKEIILSTSN